MLDKKYVIASLGLFLIGLYSFLGTVFVPDFAELHLELKFLDFPIFAGEILLFLCIVLFFAYAKYTPIKPRPWHCLFLLYITFVLVKAFYGYFKWGPLAFRNAAMFYYPLFAVICYYFFSTEVLREKVVYSAILVTIFLSILSRAPADFFKFTHIILALVMIAGIKRRPLRYAFFLLLVVIIPYYIVSNMARTVILAQLSAVIFILVALFWFLRIKLVYKAAFLLSVPLVAIILSLVVYMTADKIHRVNIKSILKLDVALENFRNIAELVDAKSRDFIEEDIPVKVYEKNTDYKSRYESDTHSILQTRKRQIYVLKDTSERCANKLKELKIFLQDIESGGGQQDKVFFERLKPKIYRLERVIDAIEPLIERSSARESEFLEMAEKSNEVRAEKDAPLPEEVLAMAIDRYNVVPQEAVTAADELETAVKDMERPAEVPPKITELSGFKIKRLEILLEQFREAALVLQEASAKVEENKAAIITYKTTFDNNIVFRMLLLRDMTKEFFESKRYLYGLDFGKPFRSKSIWVMGWDTSWKFRTGWHEPHNSYVHILYRAGIIGLASIIVVLGLLVRMTITFTVSRNAKGIFLASVILFWLVAANFSLPFELPYFAIPFWGLFGMTLKYNRLILKKL